jgi:para-nitrobenzyl esterase
VGRPQAPRFRACAVSYQAAVLACWLVTPLGLARATLDHTSAPTVRVAQGQLSGLPSGSHGGIFRGVPYARAPVGALRWRPPEPAALWTGVRAATQPAPPCLQAFVGWNRADAERGSEDCLYLEIRTPRLDRQAKLPVLVWIHGGANWGGSGRWLFDSDLAERGIVVVAIQYGLGVLGFLSHPQLSRESPRGVSGNYALMDQIAALRWVRSNIAGFGGDPDAMTVAGHSAGGQDVGLLMVSPEARGLFARAIQESGTAGFGLPPRSLAENERLGVALAELAGLPRALGTTGQRLQLEALRALDGRELLDAELRVESSAIHDQSYFYLQPVMDGWIVPADPAQLLRTGRSAQVPLLIGNAAQEIAPDTGDSGSRHSVIRGFGKSAATAFDLYGLHGGLEPVADPVLGNTPLQIATDLTFRCPAEYTAEMQTGSGQAVWRFQMEVAAPGAPRIDHGAELAFVFRNEPLDPSVDGPRPFLQSYWANFIRRGDPNGDKLPVWPKYGSQRAYVAFTRAGAIVNHGLRSQICALLQRP